MHPRGTEDAETDTGENSVYSASLWRIPRIFGYD